MPKTHDRAVSLSVDVPPRTAASLAATVARELGAGDGALKDLARAMATPRYRVLLVIDRADDRELTTADLQALRALDTAEAIAAAPPAPKPTPVRKATAKRAAAATGRKKR